MFLFMFLFLLNFFSDLRVALPSRERPLSVAAAHVIILKGRLFNTLAVQAVPQSHPLAPFVIHELAALIPAEAGNHASAMPYTPSTASPLTIVCNNTTLELSPRNGRLETLSFAKNNGGDGGVGVGGGVGESSWSRLMDFRYISFRDASKNGMVCNKSTCPNPVVGAWEPTLIGVHSNHACNIVAELGFNDTLHTMYGAPAAATVTYDVDPERKRINVTLVWRNKTTTRLQEAMTVFHRPGLRQGYRWEMDKLGEWIPSSNVTEGGMQYQHAIWSGVRYNHAQQHSSSSKVMHVSGGHVSEPPALFIGTLDAGMACPVLNRVADTALTPESALEKACFDYHIPSAADPGVEKQLNDSMIDGMGINLHGNRFTISGTIAAREIPRESVC